MECGMCLRNFIFHHNKIIRFVSARGINWYSKNSKMIESPEHRPVTRMPTDETYIPNRSFASNISAIVLYLMGSEFNC